MYEMIPRIYCKRYGQPFSQANFVHNLTTGRLNISTFSSRLVQSAELDYKCLWRIFTLAGHFDSTSYAF